VGIQHIVLQCFAVLDSLGAVRCAVVCVVERIMLIIAIITSKSSLVP